MPYISHLRHLTDIILTTDRKGDMVAKTDLRDFFTPAEVRDATKALHDDKAFQRELHRHGLALDDLFETSYPLKYLGIELGDGGKPRAGFTLADALRIALRPRSMDGASRGLHNSVHRKAFIERMPDVDALLGRRSLYRDGPSAPIDDEARFARSPYAEAAAPALERLERHMGIPVKVSLQVLRKGLAAYKHMFW